MWIALAAGFVFVIVVVGIAVQRLLTYPTVSVTVPNDFAGPLAIVCDPSAKAIQQRWGTYRIEVRDCRTIRVPSDGFLRKWAKWGVARKSGEVIPIEYEAADSVVAWRFGGWGGRGGSERFTYFVGTAREFNDFSFSDWPTPSCN
jgi:hypothetical protein